MRLLTLLLILVVVTACSDSASPSGPSAITPPPAVSTPPPSQPAALWTQSGSGNNVFDMPTRKLPRQAGHSKGDCAADEGLGRNVSGGTRPRLSWGRSLYTPAATHWSVRAAL